MHLFLILLLSFCFIGETQARSNFTGYSGAPNRGTCATSCHGNSGGTVTIENFPEIYTPGETYLVTIKKLSGNSINNFNGSCRIGSGTTNAGTLSATTGTGTYNVSGETNGIHLSQNNRDSAMFYWTAPALGTGAVNLYIAAHQGTSASGLGTALVLTSEEASNTPGNVSPQPEEISLGYAYPNPFNASVAIPFELSKTTDIRLDVFNLLGQEVATLAAGRFPAGTHRMVWNAANVNSGIYIIRLTGGTQTKFIKVVALK
ncbi:T9SS type A sorting domain-containing protein [bacterium]|nr:T9SS type A sorting domain-containing protein [bacterium]